jgi:hypothetical protein
VAYFDGHGTLHPLLVLGCWLVGGAVLYADRPEHEIEEALDIAPAR